jgi:LDH2 family malate/lactate/ureidoglycolate dehydrogenase
MLAHPEEVTVSETIATALIDGGGGLGQPVSERAMRLAMDKAATAGVGFVSVRNSNHYGIAGYYAMMALERDMIGISLTNAGHYVVPTFGRDAMLGTNPISVAAPAGRSRPFVLDMATSVVPLGKIEVYNRQEKDLPSGWATDQSGRGSSDTPLVLRNLVGRLGGGLFPLGGEGELFGGHKGYGLALTVDILSGILSGSAYSNLLYPKDSDGQPLPADIGHFFGAIRVDAFRPLDDFRDSMDDLLERLKNSPKAEGQERIYIHGEKEFETEDDRRQNGIPLHDKVVTVLQSYAEEWGLPLEFLG